MFIISLKLKNFNKRIKNKGVYELQNKETSRNLFLMKPSMISKPITFNIIKYQLFNNL